MKLLAILLALTALHYLPRPKLMQANHYLLHFFNALDSHFNGGRSSHALFIWLLGAVLPALLVGVLSFYCYKIHPLFGLIFSIFVLHATLDFSDFGIKPKKIADALDANNADEALGIAQEWQINKDSLATNNANYANQIASVSIAYFFKSAHYGLFALFLWFFVFGAAGVILFSLSFLLLKNTSNANPYEDMSHKILTALDWLPSYLTATCFAVVGDFEDAVYCWRTQVDYCKNKTFASILTI